MNKIKKWLKKFWIVVAFIGAFILAIILRKEKPSKEELKVKKTEVEAKNDLVDTQQEIVKEKEVELKKTIKKAKDNVNITAKTKEERDERAKAFFPDL